MPTATLPLTDHIYRAALQPKNLDQTEVLVVKANHVVVTYLPRHTDGKFHLGDPTFAYPTESWRKVEPELLGRSAEGDLA